MVKFINFFYSFNIYKNIMKVMNFLRKVLKMVVSVMMAAVKAPMKFGKAVTKTPMRTAFFIMGFVTVILLIVAYRRGAENFAIYQQEATLNPINNKQKKF